MRCPTATRGLSPPARPTQLARARGAVWPTLWPPVVASAIAAMAAAAAVAAHFVDVRDWDYK